ncbi:MAG TPA: phosphopantothenoylcysteine decarboxylase, partial [Gammaproteobacteria bacterium]|nr:phosphopantothenoylcysteine decarboxylase [Gammaproteobacteria bacterium]
AEDLAGLFGGGPLAGKRVLVTAGPTREAVDPVRYLTNRSSGRMGFAVAAAAAAAGGQVTLVAGPVALDTPPGVERVDVESAEEMAAAVRGRDCDLFIATAAVADYRPAAPAAQKIKRDGEDRALALAPNPDILREVAARTPPPFTVGFAAETESVSGNARAKLRDKGVDLIAANRVGPGAEGGFETADNALQVFWADGERSLPLADKRALARELIALIAERLAAADE